MKWIDKEKPRGEIGVYFHVARLGLKQLAEHPFLGISDGTRKAAERLEELLRETVLELGDDGKRIPPTEPFYEDTIRLIGNAVSGFETLFQADADALNLFHVDDVLAYAATTLIERGDALIPDALHQVMSAGIRDDIRAGARSLAFDLPLASAFHMARATEGTMRLYHEKCIGPLPPKYEQQTFGSLVKAFESAGVESSLVGFLRHIKENYRNPISHPDAVITLEDSHKLLGVYVAAITDMLGGIAKVQAGGAP